MRKNFVTAALVLAAIFTVGAPNSETVSSLLGVVEAHAAVLNTWDSYNTTVEYDGTTITVKAKPGTNGMMSDYTSSSHPAWISNTTISNSVTRVVIEEGVTRIGNEAFKGMTNMAEVSLPKGTAVIGINAFNKCMKLSTVNVLGNITSTPSSFQPGTITQVNIAEGVTELGNYLMYGQINLVNITLPSTLKKIGSNTFYNCIKLSNLVFPDGLESIDTSAFGVCNALTDVILPDTVTSVKGAFGATANLNKFVAHGITDIADTTFYNSGIREIDTPNVTSIGNKAFNKCVNLTSIDTPKVTKVGNDAFMDCTSLVSVNMPNLETLGTRAFYNAPIALTQQGSLKSIGGSALYNSKSNIENWNITGLTLGADSMAFNDITKLRLSGKFTNTIMSGFKNNPIEEIIIDNTVTGDFNDNFTIFNSSLKKIYWLGNISPHMAKTSIPATTTVMCQAGSPVEAWCKNNSVAYGILTDEEVDSIINGQLPTVSSTEQLFDADNPSDIEFGITLGTKPAGASGIKQVIVANKTVPKDMWTFNGVDTVSIKQEYLAKLTNGQHAVSIQFDNNIFKSGASVTVINSSLSGGGTKPPEALDTIKYEFYKDYPDYVIIPVTMNGATAITKLKIGTEIVDPKYYRIEDSALILDKDYLLTLNPGKYRVLPTFNDLGNTTISNIQLLVYENAADRAAPYLLQSRILFDGQPVVLKFDPGEGDLLATNVLALVMDDKMILPNGDLIPFSSANAANIKSAYRMSLEVEAPYIKPNIASSSNADKAEEPKPEKPGVASSSNADKKEDKPSIASPNDATFSTFSTRSSRTEELVNIMADLNYANDNVFTVDGNTITLDGDYVTKLGLSEGDHLIGAVFDNTEKTTDVKKVILTIASTNPNPDVPPVDPQPPLPDPEPEKPPVEPEKPPVPDVPSTGGGSNGGSGGGSSSKPSTSGPAVNNVVNQDGSLNPDYNQNVPDTGGNWSGTNDNWEYIKPDGSLARDEWVGSNGYWYFIDADGKLRFNWYEDTGNKWFMLNREHNGHFGAALKGWYYEKQDGKWYFLNPADSSLLTGWQFINGKWYYFHINNGQPTYKGNNDSGWNYTDGRPHGSMYVNETTPDGYKVNSLGEWVQ